MKRRWPEKRSPERERERRERTHLFDHLFKFLLLVLAQLLIVLDRGHMQPVLGLGFGGLEGARQNGNFGVLQHLRTKVRVQQMSTSNTGTTEFTVLPGGGLGFVMLPCVWGLTGPCPDLKPHSAKFY